MKCFTYSVVPPYRMKCEPCLAAGYGLHRQPASTQTSYLGKIPSGYRTVIVDEDEDGDPVVKREPIY
jgi:hypothetical protein